MHSPGFPRWPMPPPSYSQSGPALGGKEGEEELVIAPDDNCLGAARPRYITSPDIRVFLQKYEAAAEWKKRGVMRVRR